MNTCGVGYFLPGVPGQPGKNAHSAIGIYITTKFFTLNRICVFVTPMHIPFYILSCEHLYVGMAYGLTSGFDGEPGKNTLRVNFTFFHLKHNL